MRLNETRVLITGATGGIGTALAQAMSKRGARVIVHGRDRARLLAFARQGFETIEADLEEAGALERVAREALDRGPIDVLVNNAGVLQRMDFARTEIEQDLISSDREIALNLRVPVQLTRLLLPSLMTRPSAAIVNVTSGLALLPTQPAPVYCATKAALHSFSMSLRWQLEKSSVRVHEALPVRVDTAMTRGHGAWAMPATSCADAIVRRIERDQPTILVGKSSLLARAALFLPLLSERIMRHV